MSSLPPWAEQLAATRLAAELGATRFAADFGWVFLLGAALLLMALGAALSRALRGWKVRRRTRRALAREDDAEDILRAAGYTIEARHPAQPWTIQVDDEEVTLQLRVDYLVKRDNLLFIADAKYGHIATALRHGPTRRQLLEYLLAYNADGALLVDMTAERVFDVQFLGLSAEIER